MKPAVRHGLAIGASAALHASVLVYSLITSFFHIEFPELELEIVEVELLDPNEIQGDDGPGEDEPTPRTPPPPTEDEPEPEPPEPPKPEEPEPEPPEPPKPDKGIEEKKPEPKKKPKPKKAKVTDENSIDPNSTATRRTLGRKNSAVDRLGPTASTYHFMLVPQKIRNIKSAEAAMDIMASFPDFEYLVDDGGFDPLRDFDHMVISTPNITDPRQTFLVVDYSMDREFVKKTIERAANARGETIEWIDERGALRGNPRPIEKLRNDWDPRFFVLPEDNKIAAYIREEYVEALLRDQPGEEKTAANYVANLAQLQRFAERIPTAGMQFVAKDIRASVRGRMPIDIELPDAIELTIEASDAPEGFMRLTFLSEDEAKHAAQNLKPEMRALLAKFNALFLFGSMIDAFTVEREGKDVKLWGELTRGQLKLLLDGVKGAVASVQRKDMKEIEESRARRAENWERRKDGKLPPSELDRIIEEERRAEEEARRAKAGLLEPGDGAPQGPSKANRLPSRGEPAERGETETAESAGDPGADSPANAPTTSSSEPPVPSKRPMADDTARDPG